jgi:hypothetical protein
VDLPMFLGVCVAGMKLGRSPALTLNNTCHIPRIQPVYHCMRSHSIWLTKRFFSLCLYSGPIPKATPPALFCDLFIYFLR